MTMRVGDSYKIQVSFESEFIEVLREIAERENRPLATIVRKLVTRQLLAYGKDVDLAH